MKLVIVESPTKAKKIGAALGPEYVVKASYGHIVDLPVNGLAVDLSTMEETYEVLPKKGFHDPKQTVNQLKDLVKKADEVFLASDPDREGEAISWHLNRVLGLKSYKRIEIKVISLKGVQDAMRSSRLINANWVEAQRSRRVIDRLLGYVISPALSRNISGAKSAGRVQSAALHLMGVREREISAFKPEARFSIEGNFSQSGKSFKGFLQETKESVRKATLVGSEDGVEASASLGKKLVSSTTLAPLLAAMKQASGWNVSNVESKPTAVRPPAPYNTSMMMQTAAKVLGWSSERTMKVAQALFENGHITYHRTDSLRVAPEAIEETFDWILKNHGKEYVPSTPNVFKNKDAAQDAHECVRPAHIEKLTVTLEGGDAKKDADANSLYRLVREAFLCSQSTVGENLLTKVTIAEGSGDYQFLSSTSVVKFDGWRKMRTMTSDDAEEGMGEIIVGDCRAVSIEMKSTHTSPPPHYKEETLLKELEKLGIGRPSSWANVSKTLIDRTYIEKAGREYVVTTLGFKADDWLTGKAPHYTDAGYTAKMENDLDDIEAGRKKRTPLLESVRDDLSRIFGALSAGGFEAGVTDKMKAVLDQIKESGQAVPTEAWSDRDVAKPILDEWFKSKLPSEKQVEFARKLASELKAAGVVDKKLDLTSDILGSSIETKKYIDRALKASKSVPKTYPDKPATQKQVDWARKLAEKSGKPFDETLVNSFQRISQFIETSLGKKSEPAKPAVKSAAPKRKAPAKKKA